MMGYDNDAAVRQGELQRQLEDCKGSFKERYECKSALMRSEQQSSFYFWAERLGLVFGPPLLAYIAYNLIIRWIEGKEEVVRRKVRLARLEKEAAEARRRAKEEGRRKTVVAKRRQAVRQAEKDADREDRRRPINVLVLSDRVDVVEPIAAELLENGYLAIESDLTDAYLGYEDIGYQVVMSDLEFKTQNEYGGFRENVLKLRELKEGIRIICMSPQFSGLNEDQIQVIAKEVKAEAAIGIPFEVDQLVELLNEVVATEETAKGNEFDDDEEYEDEFAEEDEDEDEEEDEELEDEAADRA